MKNGKNKNNTFEMIGDVASQLIKSAITAMVASAKEFDVEVVLMEYVWENKGKAPMAFIKEYRGKVGDIQDEYFILTVVSGSDGEDVGAIKVRFDNVLPGNFISKDGNFQLRASRIKGK